MATPEQAASAKKHHLQDDQQTEIRGIAKKEMSPNCPANVALIPTPLLDGLARSRMFLLHLDNRGFSFQFVPFVMGQSICYPMCSRTGLTEPKNTISQIKQYQESKDIFKPPEKTFFAGYFSQSCFLVFAPFFFVFVFETGVLLCSSGWLGTYSGLELEVTPLTETLQPVL